VQCKQDSVKLGGYWYQHSGTGIHGRDDVFCCAVLCCAVLCCAVLCCALCVFYSFLFFSSFLGCFFSFFLFLLLSFWSGWGMVWGVGIWFARSDGDAGNTGNTGNIWYSMVLMFIGIKYADAIMLRYKL